MPRLAFAASERVQQDLFNTADVELRTQLQHLRQWLTAVEDERDAWRMQVRQLERALDRAQNQVEFWKKTAANHLEDTGRIAALVNGKRDGVTADGLERDITALITTCHPDRWHGTPAEPLAAEVTRKLLELRRRVQARRPHAP